MRNHTKLKAFELADEVAELVYKITAGFPEEEAAGLTVQMRRGAVSIPSTIVEGCARDTQAEFLMSLQTAYGSLKALRYQLGLARRLGFITTHDDSKPEDKIVDNEKVLFGLIRSLKKGSQGDS